MKYKLHLIISVFLLFVPISGFIAQPINPNGSFEEATYGPVVDTDAAGWSLLVGGNGKAYFEIVDNPVYDGIKALKVIIDALGSNAWDIQVVNEPFTVKPNTKYKYSIMAKADKLGPVVNFTVGEPVTYREWGRAHQVVMTTEWQQVTFEFTTPAGVTEGRAPIHLSESMNSIYLPIIYYFDDLKITEVTVDVENENQKPLTYNLYQNYPNPFNPITTIEFALPVSGKVRLSLYDILGRKVKEIASGIFDAGNHKIKLDASNLTSGIYYYKLEANDFISVKKLILMK
ncbi:MAG: carbohydrate binding domain-containing protein [Melioribacter sp.]|uniref:T9SS type A sorting domain-containing protein n=1 Tax=Rosettibacter primus TaxID=3111523 RepID=UPI00247C1F7A|nr:carbohydrate binding domain-containing protein [Melioribacter sp.]